MPRCTAYKPDGSPCERIVKASQEFCFAHDPNRSEARRRAASRGGKAKASGELGAVKANLQALADATLEDTVDRSVAAVTSQIWNVYLSAVRTELKLREVEDQERRLEEIESILAQQKEDRWRA